MIINSSLASLCSQVKLTIAAMDRDLRVDSNVMNNQTRDDLDLRVVLPCRGNITPQVIEQIEADLDFYEKVSLVFLLYDNVDIGLQRLKGAELAHLNGGLPTYGLLSDWARHANYQNWEDKFLEALCIIQNYSVVEKLGYPKNEVKARYLPETPDVALFVDLMRKALYLLSEKLTEDQERILINLVKADMPGELTSLSNHETEFLEIRFLYWISQKYISINNRTADVANLTKHLKVMEESQLVDYLESVSRVYTTFDAVEIPTVITSLSDVSSVQDRISEASSTYRENNNIETHSVLSDFNDGESGVASNIDENVYRIDPENVGYCVIINQKKFHRERNPKLKKHVSKELLEDRTGTDADRDSLCEAFAHFGFDIKIWEDLDHKQLLQTIESAATELVQENHSCFVLCILSHGIENQVYGVNSIPVSMDDIEERIQGKYCPKLLNKPKIIIVQACQGREIQDAVPFRRTSDSDISLDGPGHAATCPAISDSFVWWSTVRGYASFRHKRTGSWFIQTLCGLLLESTTDVDIEELSRKVNRKIKTKAAYNNQKTMQPMHTSTLDKRLLLPCKNAARKDVVAETMSTGK